MKPYKLLFLILVLVTIITACEGNEDPEIIVSHPNPISFDNVEVLCGVLPSGFYTNVSFPSDSIGYTTTNYGEIFKTEDGGNSWTKQNSGTDLILNDMIFLDDSNGYVIGYKGTNSSIGIILKTTDGGKSWKSTNMPCRMSSVYFLNETKGFCMGRNLYMTNDGGASWEEVVLGYSEYYYMNFYDENIGLLSTTLSHSGTTLLKTTDGGNSWATVDQFNDIPHSTVAYNIQINNNIAYLHANSNILTTPDKGNTWQVIPSLLGSSIESYYFINELQIICGGQHWYELGCFPTGLLAITNDGGKNWERFFASGFTRINDIELLNDSTALIVGDVSCILKLKF